MGKVIRRQTGDSFLLFFPQEIAFDISRKLFPQEAICMKCLSLLSGKIKKPYLELSSAEIFTQHAKR